LNTDTIKEEHGTDFFFFLLPFALFLQVDMTNTLKRQITDTDFMDSTSKPWKGKGKSVAALGTTRPRTSYHDQQEKVFGNFRLKRILRENHGYDINQLSLFFKHDNLDRPQRPDLKSKHGAIREQNDTSNILASVGGAQVIKGVTWMGNQKLIHDYRLSSI
jgi:hypothetical protein